MRKMMQREVTHTTIKSGVLELVNGEAKAVSLPDEVVIGNITMEKAQKIMNKKQGIPVTIFEVLPETDVYEMPIEEFIKVAAIKEK